MTVRLSDHLRLRMKVRKIYFRLPRRIVEKPDYLLFDVVTKHWIAVKEETYGGKRRPIVAVFDTIQNEIEIITIYPTDIKEVGSKITRGRWIYEKAKN